MESLKDILHKFDPFEDKYISREYQSFGVHLAEKLGDIGHKSLYIRLAKTIPRSILEEALRFVVDSKAKNMGALFMWKLKEIGGFAKQMKLPKNKKSAQFKAKEKKEEDPLLKKIRRSKRMQEEVLF